MNQASRKPGVLMCLFVAAMASAATYPDSLLAAETDERAYFVDRPVTTGTLAGVDSEWNLKLQVGEKLVVVPARDLIYWGSYSDAESGPQVLLRDGSIVRADVLDLATDIMTIGDATGLGRCLWDEASLPRSTVQGILLQPPADALERDRLLARIQAYRQLDDQLLLTSGETISGKLQETPRSGRFLPADEPVAEVYQLARAGAAEPLLVPAGKVVAVLLGGSLLPSEGREQGVQLGARDGSLLSVDRVVTKGDTVELSLLGGGKLTAPLDQPDEAAPTLWRQITWIRPNSEQVTYLSTLKPLGYKHIPLLTLDWPYGSDQNVLGGRLRTGSAVYTRGVGMHPISRLAYDLDGKYRRLEAELALDTAAGLRGSVSFKVLVERASNQWATAYESPVIRGGDKPVPISVDVKSARRIALIVDYADRADEQDHANWLMARLIR